jgi:hypothetical protein
MVSMFGIEMAREIDVVEPAPAPVTHRKNRTYPSVAKRSGAQ